MIGYLRIIHGHINIGITMLLSWEVLGMIRTSEFGILADVSTFVFYNFSCNPLFWPYSEMPILCRELMETAESQTKCCSYVSPLFLFGRGSRRMGKLLSSKILE